MNSLLLAPELMTGDGGIARILRLYLMALCDLAKDGDQVRFVSLNDAAADPVVLKSHSNSRLVGFETCNRGRMRYVMAALRLGLRSDRIVCGHVAQLPVARLATLLRPGTPYYLVAHGIEVWRPFTPVERWALGGVRRIWCVSEFTRDRIHEFYPMARERTTVLHNALDPCLGTPSPEPIADVPPTVLTISRLSIADNYKGVDHLISAFPAVRAEIPGARLRIVGRGDGLPGLKALADRLNVSQAVDFAGYVSDSQMGGEFARCRLFALPSQKEGFGLVYLEAMAHGRPCLGARAGGAPEVISDDTGVLVTFGDVPGIAQAIIRALRKDWRPESMIERASVFSYPRFKERIASLLSVESAPIE
jgi:phosphatidyl-myo-inositol dimannoside synthase